MVQKYIPIYLYRYAKWYIFAIEINNQSVIATDIFDWEDKNKKSF